MRHRSIARSANTRQPLVTRGQLFQIAAVPLFDQQRDLNVRRARIHDQIAEAYREFLDRLPAGYSKKEVPQSVPDDRRYVLHDDSGNEVGWPLTAAECFNRAWGDADLPPPSFEQQADVVQLRLALRACDGESRALANAFDEAKTRSEKVLLPWVE